MKVLSLFDGMACGMLAMLESGIEVDRYVAFEIDKYAVQTSSHNFPMIEHRGDVFQADFTEFRGFDFLVGGSPCTYWSIAQKNNRETEASGMGWELFQQYVRALHEAQPKFFIYENNKSMSKAIRASIDKAFGFEAVGINSALVSAQNRQRLYWVGRRNADGTYSKVHVEQPEDRGILLKDVLDGGQRIPAYGSSEKSRPLTACYAYKGCGEGSLATECFPENPNKQVRDYVAKPVAFRDKANGLCGNRGGASLAHDLKKSKHNYAAEPCIYQVPHGFNDGGMKYGKAPTLTGNGCYVENNKCIDCFAIPVEWEEDGKPTKAISGADGKTYAVYEVKDGQITIKGKQYPIKLADGFYIIRKLTVSECKRLQTVPEWYEFPVSDTQAYKMLGNGWTVEVIVHLIKATQEAELPDLFGMAVTE